jgi:hypothetical protein
VYYFPIVYRNYPPVVDLEPIPDPDTNNAYTLNWSPESPLIDHYVLQESTESDFSANLQPWTVYTTHKTIQKGAIAETFYYRVRADGAWGEGPWSNVRSVAVGFYDDFNDSDSGWPDDKGEMYTDSSGDTRHWRRGYKSGDYRIYIDQGGPLAWFYQPDALAPYEPPTNKYCVETSIKFNSHGWWANAGLIFGAEDDNDDIYAVCLSSGNKELGAFIMRNDDYEFPKRACFGDKDKEQLGTASLDWDGWNKIQVSVDYDTVDVYINGGSVLQNHVMSGLHNREKVGVVGGVYEVTPIDIRFKDFTVIPNAGCSP